MVDAWTLTGQRLITWLLHRCRKVSCLRWSLLSPLLWWLRSDSCERKPWLPAHLRPAISMEQLLSCSAPQQFTPCGHRLSTLRDQPHREGSLSPSVPHPSITIWLLFANACRRDAQPSSALNRRCEFRSNMRAALMVIWLVYQCFISNCWSSPCSKQAGDPRHCNIASRENSINERC